MLFQIPLWSIYNIVLSSDYKTLPSSNCIDNAKGFEGYTFLEVQTKNFQVFQFAFHKSHSATICHDVLYKLCFGESQLGCFAFANSQFPVKNFETNGWNLFSWEEEYRRLKLDPNEWRITDANINFELCKSYPSKFIVPAKITDSGS